MQHGLQAADGLYFAPKPWEKNGKLYELLGVKLFSKYFPNAGSYWIRKGREPKRVKSGRSEDLERFIGHTKSVESAHGVIALPLAVFTIYSAFIGAPYSAAVFGALNFVANFYPIISQRYNRNRAIQLRERQVRMAARRAYGAENILPATHGI